MTDVKQLAPDISVEDFDGNKVNLSSFMGKVVFLNFWATWCPPCRAEVPSIQELFKKITAKDFAILAVSTGENKGQVKSFVEKNKITFPVYLDPENHASDTYKVAGIPTTLIIDKDGYIMLRETGSRDWSAGGITAKIEALLK